MSGEHWASAYNKIGLVQFYLRRALKHAEEITPEMIAEMPHYADHAFPGLATQIKSDADWCSTAMEDMRDEASKPHPEGICFQCNKPYFDLTAETILGDAMFCTEACCQKWLDEHPLPTT